MFVIITGGGRTGTQLASYLIGQNHRVRVVEGRRDILARIHHELPTETIYEGNPTDPAVLRNAGICDAQVLAACMDNDSQNLAICYLGRAVFKVPRTVARINNPRVAWLFGKDFHVDVAVNQAEIMSSLIEEEMSLGETMTLLALRRGRYSLVEEKIPAGSMATGAQIKDLGLPDQCVIAAVIRKGELLPPRGSFVFQEGDEVYAITDRQGAERFAQMLGQLRTAESTTSSATTT